MLAAGCGGEAETVTVTATQTVPAETAVPIVVEQKRLAILEAAEAGDVEAVAALAAVPFNYSFGGSEQGGAADYWRELEANGERPMEALAAILRMPYTLSTGHYVWPFAYDKTEDAITDYERRLLESLPPDAPSFIEGGGYYGWRAGIEPDGDWVFFVAGD